MKDLHGVFYTDGGCRPNNGYGGSGYHGYLFTPEVPKKGNKLQGWSVTPRGYMRHNEVPDDDDLKAIEKETGNAIKTPEKISNVTVHEYWDYSQGLEFPSTNNVAEVQAFCHLLKKLLETEVKKVTVFIDSKYVVDGTNEWLPKWMTRDFADRNEQPITNRNYWISISESLKVLREKGCVISVEWIKGHEGHLGNELADYQATLGVISSRKSLFDEQFNKSPSEGYWAPKVEIHPFVTLPRWYFTTSTNNLQDDKGRYCYHFGSHGKDDNFIGKPIAGAAFGIVKLYEKIPHLEAVRTFHNKIVEDGLVRVAVARTDYTSNPYNYNLLMKYHDRYITQEGVKPDSYMYLPLAKKAVQVSRELSPPKLSFHLVEIMQNLEQKLNYYEQGKELENLKFTDITTQLFETTSNKKGKTVTKIRPDVTNVVKSLSVNVSHPIGDTLHQVALTLGIDLPSRNELSRIAHLAPKVTVIAWKESPHAFRTATIIETEEGIGIWSGQYANIHLVV